jgi:hypothetical protein
MTTNRTLLDRFAERVMDLDSPAYGDERERAVSMEANTFGLTAGLYVGLLAAALFSLFGLLLLPVALLVFSVLPSAVATWYARRRGVNLHKLAENAGSRSTMVAIAIYGVALMLTFAAMAYTVFAGQPIISAPSIEVTPGEGFLGGMAQGAVIGGILGGLAAVVGGALSFRRANRRRRAASATES